MGINIFKRSSSSSFDFREYNNTPPNPNPENWKLIRDCEIGDYLILELQYPDCINFEGRKILVFKDKYFKILEKNKMKIDPHFSNNNDYISPVARFEPTEKGWNMAVTMCEILKDKKQ